MRRRSVGTKVLSECAYLVKKLFLDAVCSPQWKRDCGSVILSDVMDGRV